MRHLILTLDFPPIQDGGIARSMDETARGLAAAGESVRVLTRGRGRPVRNHDASYPVPVTRMSGHHWKRRHPAYLQMTLPKIGRKERDAIVHTATWEVAPFVQRVAPRYGWKTIVHAQGREVARTLSSETERNKIEPVLRIAHAVLPISRYVRDQLLSLGAAPERVHLIPPAIEAKRIQGGQGDRIRTRFGLGRRPVVLTLARLTERKGHDTVIRALPRVLQEIPDVAYIVAGKGDQQKILERLARDTGVADNVFFTGFVPEAETPDVYAAADLYVMVSRVGKDSGDIEGFGITYLEAAAVGLPVVAGRSGGTADAVEDGVTGVLVDPTDALSVGGAIIGLLRDRDRARQMGQAGRARVERDFTSAARAAKILAITGRIGTGAGP